jgi:branched-chain amino acid aminotransferase
MGMHPDRTIWTWFEDRWERGNVKIMGAADHGTWLGTMVFDGARAFDGVTPDLDRHCARVNHSAAAMNMRPTVETGKLIELVQDGIARFNGATPLYIRPMYWSLLGGARPVEADPESTQFALCIEEAEMGNGEPFSITTTRFERPTLASNLTNAKASCLYPNNARMLHEAHAKGFDNAIVCDALGNVAETATSNIFMVRGGTVFTPVPNGTFLNGITRQRVIALLRQAGYEVHETTLTPGDFRVADEIFSTGNWSKVVAIHKFDDYEPGLGPVAEKARELYFEWAHRQG